MPLDTRWGDSVAGEATLMIGQVLQRIYKYGGQPFARDYLAQHHGGTFDRFFGRGTGKAMMHATAGRCV